MSGMRDDEPTARQATLLRGLLFLGTAAIIVALDQATKLIIKNSLDRGDQWPEDWAVRIVHVTNSGAAFGILQGETLFLVVTSIIAIGAIAFYYFFPPSEHPLAGVALGLLLGGALGNFINRVLEGEVVDFIKFPNFPAFNVADSSISVGIALLFIFALLSERSQAGEHNETTSTQG